MRDKLCLPYPIIVEGKYDLQKLKNIVSSPVITLGGFAVFGDRQKRMLLAKLSASGVIVLTDSDNAGRFIRSRIRQYLDPKKTIDLYIPKIKGKEKRKTSPSADGYLGVEGMDDELLYQLLLPYVSAEGKQRAGVDKMTFYRDGLSGRPDSAARRRALAKKLGLPEDLTANALVEAIDLTVTAEQYRAALEDE